ncbi:hypothetical protein [Ruegeria marina]|nr:hypothetical protein [Ruegeria marina]
MADAYFKKIMNSLNAWLLKLEQGEVSKATKQQKMEMMKIVARIGSNQW